MYTENHCSLDKVVTIEDQVYESMKGRYFIGQSNLLTIEPYKYVWGALYNPKNSGVNLYVSVVTVTNTSDVSIKSRIYMNPHLSRNYDIVKAITPANLAICPPPKPEVCFLVGSFCNIENIGGVKAFTRIVPANSTLANEKDGKIIIPPGKNIMMLLVPPGDEIVEADIAYGWWEKPIDTM